MYPAPDTVTLRVRAGLQNRSRKYPVGGKDWPRVLWKDECVDSDNLSKGWMRNDRLVMVCIW